jgi:hypothetical protein
MFSIHESPVHVHKRILLAAILTYKHNTVNHGNRIQESKAQA